MTAYDAPENRVKRMGPYYNLRVHFVYIVRCADGTLYTGYARDPGAREQVHNSGHGARYTAGRRPVRLVYWESFESIGDALRRERQLKRLRRARKEALLTPPSRRPLHASCARPLA
jgi:putative endonuclease